ncbi:MAG: alanine--tRNA ligase [Chloroflexi bacterium]|nr:alanine--tRNA ligase [Chloroflexota bacterium]
MIHLYVPMNSDDIRTRFVRYFERQGHQHLPSASLVPHGDPSVLFTSAGMQQFKPFYVQPHLAPAPRVVTVQRCLRTDDIDEVGDDTHHSFFEMLGNFSFGDYFKREAIAYAYELVTQEYGLPPERIWATVFGGQGNVPPDDEAAQHWQAAGVSPERIRAFDHRENWWGPTGDEGPCGPCSEIHLDLGPAAGCGRPLDECGPNHNCGRFVEIWNLVFNQYYSPVKKEAIFRSPEGTLRPLERPGIDTGAGFERIAAVLQGVPSAYEADVLRPIVQEASAALDAPYGEDPDITRSLRIVVDHARAVTFLIADGVLPSNEERGYVVRRLLRRAVRYGRLLGHSGPFLGRLVQAAIERFAPQYPYLREKQAVIGQIVAQEEQRFAETLSDGLQLLNRELELLERRGSQERVVPAATGFRLYDTYGFPVELTQEVAAGRGFEVDVEGFEGLLRSRQEQSRAGQKFTKQEELDLPSLKVEFLGYERIEVDGARVEFLSQGGERVATAHASDAEVWLVLDRTPFYPERGGQVGDRGWLIGPHGRMQVRTTQSPLGEVIVHVGEVVEGHIALGDLVRAEVHASERRATMRHHTATHLLHAALRAELGPHVHQAGSLVAPDRLRFDFSHGQALTPEQRRAVQRRVNDAIRRNLPVRIDVMSLDAAMESGAIALFDEKYGDTARVVSIDEVSKELCGGTHVARTGDIGFFVVVGEASIGSGIRRIEALAGEATEDFVNRQFDVLDEVARVAGVPREETPARVSQMTAELAALRRRLEAAERRAASGSLAEVLAKAEKVTAPQRTFKLLAAEVDASAAPNIERLREAADWLRDKLGGASVMLLASVPDGRPQLLATVSKELTAAGFDAGKLFKEAAQAMGARGGGRLELAQGGGGDPAKLAAALERGRRAARAQAGVS